MMPLCFATDNNCFGIFLVAAYSFLKHNPDIEIRLMVVDLAGEYRKIAEQLGIECTEISLDDYTCGSVDSKAIFAKLFIPDVFPSLDQCIYIDCDTICLRPLDELMQIADGNLASVVYEPVNFGEDHPSLAGIDQLDGFVIPSGRMFNAGVMHMNLAQWRRQKIGKTVYGLVKRHSSHMRWGEQTALNIVLGGRVGNLPDGYNVIPTYSWTERTLETSWIVHYAEVEKPWTARVSGEIPPSWVLWNSVRDAMLEDWDGGRELFGSNSPL
jgi:lipopolysaccharide biosynthesis glycosyltransferase